MIITVIGKFDDGTDMLKLNPEAPHNWIFDETDGAISSEVYLGKGTSPDGWRDATDEEYEDWKKRQESEFEE